MWWYLSQQSVMIIRRTHAGRGEGLKQQIEYKPIYENTTNN